MGNAKVRLVKPIAEPDYAQGRQTQLRLIRRAQNIRLDALQLGKVASLLPSQPARHFLVMPIVVLNIQDLTDPVKGMSMLETVGQELVRMPLLLLTLIHYVLPIEWAV